MPEALQSGRVAFGFQAFFHGFQGFQSIGDVGFRWVLSYVLMLRRAGFCLRDARYCGQEQRPEYVDASPPTGGRR